MNAVFADAGYWITLFNPRDQLHTKALTVSNTLQGLGPSSRVRWS